MNTLLKRNMKDEYFVKLRKQQNLLSRAYFKIEEIDKKYDLIQSGSKVLELGAAPGGWTQYIVKKTKSIVAIDLLPLKVSGVKFFQENLYDFEPEDSFDLILSDIAPNLTGNWSSDSYKMESILECILTKYINYLKPGGSMAMKIFNNQQFLKQFQKLFKKSCFFKPKSSKSNSREMYFIGINKL